MCIEKMIDGIMNNCYESSASNRYFAWLKEGKEYDSETLCVIDLETGERREITGNGTERLRPVAFMGEDGVSVVVSTDSGELTGEDVARITDIAMKETGYDAAGIRIMAAN